MLRYFSPEEVGMFSVISQIGFFWTTLALAQTPLRLLANDGISVFDDVRAAWLSSIQRFLWLLPVTAVAVWWSGLSFVSALLWTFLLSICQLTWLLAQSMRLRMRGTLGHVITRVLPPFISLLFTFFAVHMQWHGTSLLFAALLGYATGAISILPSFFSTFRYLSKQSLHIDSSNTKSITKLDVRPTWLRMSHSLIDALLATSLLVIWQRQFGAQETGWLAAPLRVMGFIPAVIHMAWAQVLLTQQQKPRIKSTLVGIAGFSFVAFIGVSSFLALNLGLISHNWHGVKTYIWMLVLWQGCACMNAAFSHLPFQTKQSVSYSLTCIVITIPQFLILLVPVFLNYELSPHLLFKIFVITSLFGYLLLLLVILKKNIKNRL
jgi:hypothetical protein